MDYYQLEDSTWMGPLILSIQKAIVMAFTSGDWRELGYLTGQQDYIQNHSRLLRSLGFGDDDYGDCVFQVLRYFTHQAPQSVMKIIEHPKIRPQLEVSQPDKLIELGFHIGHVPSVPPVVGASEVVRRALSDADQLLATSGPTSAIDRLHTALHGYLKSACQNSGIPLAPDATLTQAYKVLRTQHPALQSLGGHDGEVGKILSSFASMLDALNTLRNHASVAHPNDNLIGTAEGSLAVNAVRTIFHYLNQKIGE